MTPIILTVAGLIDCGLVVFFRRKASFFSELKQIVARTLCKGGRIA